MTLDIAGAGGDAAVVPKTNGKFLLFSLIDRDF